MLYLTFINQNNVKNTTNDIIAKQELPATAIKLISTPRTSCSYFLPKGVWALLRVFLIATFIFFLIFYCVFPFYIFFKKKKKKKKITAV